ncbi:hypothetical protein Dda_1546 [Drechslerella dactyloides]|uniref:Uncharacterized protein n=1 Tax=Drechslerella dactyloides TaxID=74499 RepID=A0AAD6NN70_DREDA|nr:hypothetical protein Dda_1546 [Drechslerella dactyloides]
MANIYDFEQDNYLLSTSKRTGQRPLINNSHQLSNQIHLASQQHSKMTAKVHHIHVCNMSGHPQRFEVHGWNGDKDLVVKPHHTAKLAAADGTSGAIIAIHGGQEGEQAEITKAGKHASPSTVPDLQQMLIAPLGFGGNDFIDLSNIVGAGGNMVVQQVGAPGTRKGDPLFMQHCNNAWEKASNDTKDKLKKSVTLKNGKVIRIGPIKDNPDLEDFVRTFADGKTYIGVGSWGGSPGEDSDNKQSSAAKGSKDILVSYNDGDARPHKQKKGDKEQKDKKKDKKNKAQAKIASDDPVDEVDSDDQSENESVAGDEDGPPEVDNGKPAKGPNMKAKKISEVDDEEEEDSENTPQDDEKEAGDKSDDKNEVGEENFNTTPPSEEDKKAAKSHQGGPPTQDDAEVDKQDEAADKKRRKDKTKDQEKDSEPNYDHPLFKGLSANSPHKKDSPTDKSPGKGDHQENGTKGDDSNDEAKHSSKGGDNKNQSANHGPGITLVNKSNKPEDYFFYNNLWNGNGTAGANFDHPMKSVHLKPDDKKFVKLPTSFKGRVQRGKDLPCTWVEFQLEASDDHGAHGDISVEQGCDGAAKIASTDGSGVSNGFDFDVIKEAPEAAIRRKPNGEKAIDTTEGNWMTGPNHAAIYYLNKKVGQKRAYITGGTGVPDVASKNRQLLVEMY